MPTGTRRTVPRPSADHRLSELFSGWGLLLPLFNNVM